MVHGLPLVLQALLTPVVQALLTRVVHSPLQHSQWLSLSWLGFPV